MLILAFWTGLLFTLWFSYDYARAMIPDKLSIVVDEKETFRFPFPVQATVLDDSQEVVLNNESNIPAGQLHLQRDETFSLYSENQGTYHLGLKLFGSSILKTSRSRWWTPSTQSPAELRWAFT